MQGDFDLADLKRRMHGAISVLRTEFSGLRTGRASINILEPVMVEAYGLTAALTSWYVCMRAFWKLRCR